MTKEAIATANQVRVSLGVPKLTKADIKRIDAERKEHARKLQEEIEHQARANAARATQKAQREAQEKQEAAERKARTDAEMEERMAGLARAHAAWVEETSRKSKMSA